MASGVRGGSLWGGSAAARTVVRDDNLLAELHPFELVALATFESHDHLAVGAARRKTQRRLRLGHLGDFWATPATPRHSLLLGSTRRGRSSRGV